MSPPFQKIDIIFFKRGYFGHDDGLEQHQISALCEQRICEGYELKATTVFSITSWQYLWQLRVPA